METSVNGWKTVMASIKRDTPDRQLQPESLSTNVLSDEAILGPKLKLIIACFIGISMGISSLYFYSLGIFIKPLAEEFDWSRGEASLGALVGTAGLALMSVPVGRLVDRHGSVSVAVVSLFLLAAGFAALGTVVTGLLSFLLLNSCLALLAAGSSSLPFARLIVTYFYSNRGLALGLALSGTGVGAMLAPMLLSPFVDEHGWRAGYLMLAAIVAFTTPVLWLALRGYKTTRIEQGQAMPFKAMLTTPSFILIGTIFFLAAISVLGAVVQFVPMLSDWGLSAERVGVIAGLVGVGTIAGRLIAGFLLDRFQAHHVTIGLFVLAAFGLVLLSFAGLNGAIAGALIVGLAVGAEVDLVSFLVARYFDRRYYGQVFGGIYCVFLVGGALGPAISGFLKDFSGDYALSLLVSAGLLVFSAILATQIGRLRPIGDIDRQLASIAEDETSVVRSGD